MTKAIDRILLFIKETGISARQFDISIGTANGYTLRMHKNKASVGSDVIEKIIFKYPQLNLVWLITGKGEMFLDRNKNVGLDAINLNAIESLIEEKIGEKLAEDNSKILKGLLKDINKEIDETKRKTRN